MAVWSVRKKEKQNGKGEDTYLLRRRQGKDHGGHWPERAILRPGLPVVLSQFLKGSTSGELNVLRNLPNYHYVEAPTTTCKFVFQMDDQEKMEYSQQVRQHFADTVEAVKKYHAKLLVMDEVLDAVAMGMLSDEALAEFLRNRPEDLEVVMTGRAPTPCTDPLADYITRMQKVRHPFDKGLNARLGVEF